MLCQDKSVAEMTEKRIIDWDRAEAEYRAGQLTVIEIGNLIGVTEGAVRRRAKTRGWTRDLTDAVRRRIRTDLARAAEPGIDEDAAIDLAARRGVEVIRSHYATLSRGHGLVNMLMAELDEATVHRREIAEAIDDETAQDAKGSKRREMMQRAVALPGRAAVMRDLAGALGRIIPLERQAFNLDTTAADDRDARRAETLEQLAARRDQLDAELAALDGPESGL